MDWPRLSTRVEAEFREAAQWYEDRRSGLGDEFLDAVLYLLRRVYDSPEQFARIDETLRRAVLPRQFPFSIYFRVRGEEVEVLAILHDARDPEEWRERGR